MNLNEREERIRALILQRLQIRRNTIWTPQAKQREALESEADELFYGGAARGGKTDLGLGIAALNHKNSILFRRTFPNLRAMIKRAYEIYGRFGKYNSTIHSWVINDKSIELGTLQYEDDKRNFQGQPHDLYFWDEITEFTESQYTFVNAWNSTIKKGQRCRIIAAGNPPSNKEGRWVIKRWAAWLDTKHPNPARNGELRYYWQDGEQEREETSGKAFEWKGETIRPRSRTFIPARIEDNLIQLEADPDYIQRLMLLPEPMRTQIRYGDFTIGEKDDDWQLIPTAWLYAAQERWKAMQKPDVPMTAMGCDLSYGGSDSNVNCEMYANWIAPLQQVRGIETKDGGKTVAWILRYWHDDAPIGYDALAQCGGAVKEAFREVKANSIGIEFSRSSTARSTNNALGFFNLRAECYWRVREFLDPSGTILLALPPDPELFSDLAAVIWSTRAGKVVIEPKEEIKKKIGRSPDKGDALALCCKASAMFRNYAPIVLSLSPNAKNSFLIAPLSPRST